MSEEAVNVPMVVVGMLAIAAIIIGLLMAGVMPGIDSVKKNRDLEMACTGYTAEVGCNNAACTTGYDEARCKAALQTNKITLKGGTTDLWKMCQEVGLANPRDCQIRCCGTIIVGSGAACGNGVACDTGLRCDGSTEKCVKA